MMQPQIHTTFHDECLADAAGLMRDHRAAALVVVDGEHQPVGVVTERDLLQAMADGLSPRRTPVSACMTTNPVTVTPETDIRETAMLMIAHGVRQLPVVERGATIGMVSARDLLLLQAWPAPEPGRPARAK
jgi:CBS domain-containing protein